METLDYLLKRQEELNGIRKQLDRINRLLNGETTSQTVEKEDISDDLPENERKFLQLERRYQTEINRRDAKMKAAKEKIVSLSMKLEKLEERKRNLYPGTELYNVCDEYNEAYEQLKAAQDEYEAAEDGEPGKRWLELAIDRATGKKDDTWPAAKI